MRAKRVILRSFVVIVVLIALLYGLYKYKNLPPKPDYFEVYKTQETVPVGKVGVIIVGHIQPGTLEMAYWYNIAFHVFNSVIPWPFRNFAKMDRGIALMDPENFYEFKEFTPTKLEDPFGNDCNFDGDPYIEKYKRGEVKWVSSFEGPGYFVYAGRKGGMPTAIGASINKARIWYYDKGIRQKKIPHWEQSFKFVNGTIEKLREKYPNVEYRSVSCFFHYKMKEKLYELMDAGCNTIVLESTSVIYSHFEDFNADFYHCFEYIHEWEEEHPGKKIKVIIAPPMGDFKPLRQAYLEMLKDRLDTLPEGADVMVAVTVHGMPWDDFSWEAWLELAPEYRDKLFDEVKELVKTYKFGRTNVVRSQDEFACDEEDPDDKYLATHEAYQDAIKDGYDYAIGLPIEFLAENTDTLFSHASQNYEGFGDFEATRQIDYPDWSVPYIMEFKEGKTHIIYNGVPVGKYQTHVTEAMYQAIDSVLSKRNGG